MRRSLLALLVTILFASGCGPKWIVVVEAAPNPFHHQGRFSVLPVEATAFDVGDESLAQYFSHRDPEQRASFEEDVRALDDNFTRSLIAHAKELGFEVVPATGPAAAPFLIRPILRSIEPGFMSFVSKPSEVQMTLRITAPDGRILDEVKIKHQTQPDLITRTTSGQRLRVDGDGLGVTAAEYVRSRIGGGDE